MIHHTETCDAGAARLAVYADTTPANVHEAPRTAPIHDALAAKGLAPPGHLVDAIHVNGDHLIVAREQHGIDLIGPGRENLGWQNRTEEAFSSTDFAVDWDRHTLRYPEGKESFSWHESPKRPQRCAIIRALFRATDCRTCPSRSRCTRSDCLSRGWSITILPRPDRRLVRRPTHHPDPNIALRCPRHMTREFATSVRSFKR